jgi:Vam6/Vps39-like protein vacuolar protein sorting-associated protein 39
LIVLFKRLLTQTLTPDDTPRRAVETLIRYLSDRRPKVYPSLAAVGITPGNQSHKIPSLNETPVEELFELPNLPLSALTPEQLLRFAQIVDTALFKSYLNLTNRGVLVGSLCRIPNWIEITEVEEELRARNVSGYSYQFLIFFLNELCRNSQN